MAARDLRPDAPPIAGLSALSFYDYVPTISPRASAPTHLKQAIDVLLEAPRSKQRFCIAAPRQHGKSTTARHIFPFLHMKFPRSRFFYATYAQEYTEIQSRDIRRLYLASGHKMVPDYNTLKGWQLESGGDFTASSVDGRANGIGSNFILIDDPYKGPEEAYNARHRETVFQWFLQVVVPMLAPGGSIGVLASRWETDDLSGRLIREQGYDEIVIPAINDGTDPSREIGAPLCPWGPNPEEPRTLEFLTEIKDGRLCKDGVRRGGIGEHAWSALFQGKPLPRSGALFSGVTVWRGPLPKMRRIALGIDVAYSAGSGSDFSVILVLGEDDAGRLFVVYVSRGQRPLPGTEALIRQYQQDYPGCRTGSFVSGPEVGCLDLMLENGVVVERLPARWNKLVRAQKSAIAWNRGEIFVPEGSPEWLAPFLHEIHYFTGVNDTTDDQVDGLSSAFELLITGKPFSGFSEGFLFGRPCV